MKNILVVENDSELRKNIFESLDTVGLNIKQMIEAHNGKKALEILGSQPVDMMVTELEMPVMDGLEMLGQIRSDPTYPVVPTLVISSQENPRLLNAISKSGLGYIQKPFDGEAFREKVLSLLNRYDEQLV